MSKEAHPNKQSIVCCCHGRPCERFEIDNEFNEEDNRTLENKWVFLVFDLFVF